MLEDPIKTNSPPIVRSQVPVPSSNGSHRRVETVSDQPTAALARRQLFWLTVVGTGLGWSLLEWPELLATREVRFETVGQYALFVLLHVSICVLGGLLTSAVSSAMPWALARLARRTRVWNRPHGSGWGMRVLLLTAIELGLIYAGSKLSFVHSNPAPTVLLISALPALLLAHAAMVDLCRDEAPRWPYLKALGAAVAAVAAHIFNRLYYPTQFFMFHLALGALGLFAIQIAVSYVLQRARVRLSRVPALACFTAAIVPVAFAFLWIGRSNDVRHALFLQAGESRSLLYIARKLTDFDGDGFSSLLGGGDLAGFNRSVDPVHPRWKGPRPPTPSFVTSEQCGSWKPKRVVLITIDALRADRLPTYGYARPTAPSIAELARRSTVFDWAWALTPGTGESVAKIFGYPSHTVTASLRQKGIRTHAILRPVVLAQAGEWLGHEFDDFRVRNVGDRQIADEAIQMITTAGEGPQFFWIHLYSPHAPYEDWRDPPHFGEGLDGLYDREVYEADQALGRIVAALPPDTAILVTADHGEELWEHGGVAHGGYGMYNEVIHIPLLLSLPGGTGRRVNESVSHRDIGPTITELLGLCGEPLPGRSLLPAAAGRPLHAMQRPLLVGPRTSFYGGALIEGRWKLTYILFNSSYGLYDYLADPQEKHNLFGAHPDVARRMVERLQTYLAYPPG